MENPIQVALGRAFDGLGVVSTAGNEDRTETPGFEVRTPTRTYVVRALWAGAGWPADVARAIRSVEGDWPRDLVVVARHLSPGSRELLESRDANWVDENGQARVVGPDFLVVREAAAQSDDIGTGQHFTWSPSAQSIAEAVLSRSWPSGIGTAELASITGWSPTQVSQVLQAFDANRWTTKWGPRRGPRSRREVSDPSGLLDAWAAEAARDHKRVRFAEATFSDPMRFLREAVAPVLDDYVRWAVTGWAAAELIAPYATTVPSLQIYVAEDDFTGALTEAMKVMQGREVDEGGRVEFRPASLRLFQLSARSSGLPVASPPRVFADLRSLGGRAEDVASHVRDEVIVPKLRRTTRRRPSTELVEWDRRCREMLHERIGDELGDARTVYTAGTWSVSYFVLGSELSLNELKVALDATRGRETGWPPWWVPTREEIRPRPRNGGIECWFRDNALREPGHADFWRAEPGVRMFLLRGYQEDEITGEPGTTLDLTLPIWRVGESLLHAARMARYVEAPEIRFLVHWTGLEGRELRTVAAPERMLPGGRVSQNDQISTYVQATPDEIDTRLPSVVEALVSPLFEVFDFFVPPLSLYVEELHTMRERSASG